MSRPIHFTPDRPELSACGIDSREGDGFWSRTNAPLAVTCLDCKATPAYAASRQIIPNIPVPVYRHG